MGSDASSSIARAALAERIAQALQSSDPDKVLEGQVARAVGDDVVDFNRKIGANGTIGEVDVETHKVIIEVTTRRSGKAQQIQKLLSNPDINPASKPVILFAPNYGRAAAQAIADAGATVVRTEADLLAVLATL